MNKFLKGDNDFFGNLKRNIENHIQSVIPTEIIQSKMKRTYKIV